MSEKTDDKPILLPIIASLAVAIFLLVFWVLPAEHNIDPTGFGKLTGLTGLSDEESHALEIIETAPVTVTESFELLGFESLEYKLELTEHAGMVFTWTSSAPVHFDMHAEPEGAEEGIAVSFADGDADRQSGTYTAEFGGEHGWYWANEGAEAVTVDITVHGFAETSALYRDGQVQRKTLGGSRP